MLKRACRVGLGPEGLIGLQDPLEARYSEPKSSDKSLQTWILRSYQTWSDESGAGGSSFKRAEISQTWMKLTSAAARP